MPLFAACPSSGTQHVLPLLLALLLPLLGLWALPAACGSSGAFCAADAMLLGWGVVWGCSRVGSAWVLEGVSVALRVCGVVGQ